jgi:sugar-specific transcriptional regulator TrmB
MDKYLALEELGLDAREAKVYVKLIELGQTSASALAKTINIERPTVYNILDNMIKKGIVTYSISAGKKLFSGVKPDILLQILESKKKIIQEFIPELNTLSKISASKPFVETYVGIRGIKTIYDDFIIEGKDINCIMNAEDYRYWLDSFFIKNFIQKRKEKHILFKCIVNRIIDPILEEGNKDNLRVVKVIKNLSINSTIVIYGKKCGFLNLTETPVGIIIENEMIASSMRMMFEHIWKGGK